MVYIYDIHHSVVSPRINGLTCLKSFNKSAYITWVLLFLFVFLGQGVGIGMKVRYLQNFWKSSLTLVSLSGLDANLGESKLIFYILFPKLTPFQGVWSETSFYDNPNFLCGFSTTLASHSINYQRPWCYNYTFTISWWTSSFLRRNLCNYWDWFNSPWCLCQRCLGLWCLSGLSNIIWTTVKQCGSRYDAMAWYHSNRPVINWTRFLIISFRT